MAVLLALSGCLAFAMAWAIGAQDVSNALGTSVGSKAITVKQAIYIGAICEFLGSLAGGEVANTISGGVLQLDVFSSSEYITCMFSTMTGAFLWLAVATVYSLPVSTTHSLIGALVGVGVLSHGTEGIQWNSISRIVSSWISSPVSGGIISFAIYFLITKTILGQPDPEKAAKERIRYFTAATIGVCVSFLGLVGPKQYRLSSVQAIVVGFCAVCVSLVVSYIRSFRRLELFGINVSRWTTRTNDSNELPLTKSDRTRSDKSLSSSFKAAYNGKPLVQRNANNGSTWDETERDSLLQDENSGSTSQPEFEVFQGNGDFQISDEIKDETTAPMREHSFKTNKSNKMDVTELKDSTKSTAIERAEASFIHLMVITACVVSFAHGSNDVSNSIGPFGAMLATRGSTETDIHGLIVPSWVSVAGGVGIVVGLATYGYRVMATVGEKIASLTYARGFAAQVGTALTVLSATQLGISVSTTHCLIGAIAGVALVEGAHKLNASTLKRIVASWVITLPASAFFAVIVQVLVQFFMID